MSAKAAIDWAHGAAAAVPEADPRSMVEINETIQALAAEGRRLADPAAESLAALDRKPTLAELRTRETDAYRVYASAAADVFAAEGNEEMAEWFRATARGDTATGHRIWIRRQARAFNAGEPLDRHMSEDEFSEVLREAERMKGATP